MAHHDMGGNQTYNVVTRGGFEVRPNLGSVLAVIDAGFGTLSGVGAGSSNGPFATVEFRNKSIATGAAIWPAVALESPTHPRRGRTVG